MRLLFLCLLPTLSFAAPTESKESFDAGGKEPLPYLRFLPDRYEEGNHPLVIFLHGAGERGGNLEILKKHGPPKTAMEGHGFPFVLVAPQCPQGRWWDPDAVIALTRELVGSLRIDASRVHLTGLSMGGFGTWACLAKAPDLYASGVPICGGGDPADAEALTEVPIWAFHGEKDTAVPVARTRDMEVAILKAGGKRFRVTYYPDEAHESWTPAYANPALFAWMMLQQKK